MFGWLSRDTDGSAGVWISKNHLDLDLGTAQFPILRQGSWSREPRSGKKKIRQNFLHQDRDPCRHYRRPVEVWADFEQTIVDKR